jgi:MtN3 and saliva related transmembrane protein
MASFVPQVVKIIREHDASSISSRMYVVTVVGFALWATYGVLLQSWPLAASNLVSLSLATLILVLKFRYAKNSAAPIDRIAASDRRGAATNQQSHGRLIRRARTEGTPAAYEGRP